MEQCLIDFWYHRQLLALSAEQRIAFVAELQTRHEDRSDSVQQSLVIGYTGPGFVTFILLHGDPELSRDFPGLIEADSATLKRARQVLIDAGLPIPLNWTPEKRPAGVPRKTGLRVRRVPFRILES